MRVTIGLNMNELEIENKKMKELFKYILEMEGSFYTEGQGWGKIKRLPEELLPYAGPLKVIFGTAYAVINDTEEFKNMKVE